MFTLRKNLVLEICSLITEKKLDITWAAISRVDRIDEEMLKAMRMAGCIRSVSGWEAAQRKSATHSIKNSTRIRFAALLP